MRQRLRTARLVPAACRSESLTHNQTRLRRARQRCQRADGPLRESQGWRNQERENRSDQTRHRAETERRTPTRTTPPVATLASSHPAVQEKRKQGRSAIPCSEVSSAARNKGANKTQHYERANAEQFCVVFASQQVRP